MEKEGKRSCPLSLSLSPSPHPHKNFRTWVRLVAGPAAREWVRWWQRACEAAGEVIRGPGGVQERYDSFRRGTSIYVLVGSRATYLALWHTCEHLELSQLPHTSLLLISLAWSHIRSEIEWSKCIYLWFLYLVGTWVFSCCGILVSLGDCRHPDDLE
jgi:hypothetical protein